MTNTTDTPAEADELPIEEVWRVADLIRDAAVDTAHGSRSVGYYLRVGIDHFGHPIDREQALLNEAARAALQSRATPPVDEGANNCLLGDECGNLSALTPDDRLRVAREALTFAHDKLVEQQIARLCSEAGFGGSATLVSSIVNKTRQALNIIGEPAQSNSQRLAREVEGDSDNPLRVAAANKLHDQAAQSGETK